MQEYWSGTDPLLGDSCFRIISCAIEGSHVSLAWENRKVASALPSLCVEMCTNLREKAWTPVGEAHLADGTNTWRYVTPGNAFYRLSTVIECGTSGF